MKAQRVLSSMVSPIRELRTEEVKKISKPINPRTYVHATAYWGNDDAESSIKLSRKQWAAIQAGAEYETRAWGWIASYAPTPKR
jgi:hypothetical protein